MGAEIIALGLQQIRRQHGAAILVEERESGAEGGHRDAALGGGGDDVAPAFLAALDFPPEIIIQQQVHELGIVVVGYLDLAEGSVSEMMQPPRRMSAMPP